MRGDYGGNVFSFYVGEGDMRELRFHPLIFSRDERCPWLELCLGVQDPTYCGHPVDASVDIFDGARGTQMVVGVSEQVVSRLWDEGAVELQLNYGRLARIRLERDPKLLPLHPQEQREGHRLQPR